jgi:hypothetical protein
MSKRNRTESTTTTDEPVVAVRPPGPLAPWRLTLSVAVAAATTGMPLVDAAATGEQLDLALGKSFGAALLTWIAVGGINRVLADTDRAGAGDDAAVHDTEPLGAPAGAPQDALSS